MYSRLGCRHYITTSSIFDIDNVDEHLISLFQLKSSPVKRYARPNHYHHLPSFFTSFLSLLSFFRASTSIHGIPLALASSQ